MGELTAFEKRLNALRNFTVMEPRAWNAIIKRVWDDDPEIQAVMAPLIAGVDRLGVTLAAEIAFAIFLAMLDEEVSNGKDIEVE